MRVRRRRPPARAGRRRRLSAARSTARPGDDYLLRARRRRGARRPVLALPARGHPRAVARRRHRARSSGRAGLAGCALDELVIYELHVGTFTPRGRSTRRDRACRELRELGVTAIELMPVATFPGERGWGYDGVYAYAPHRAYGGPEGLARLVDAAHAAGLGVILDVVYNHIGPGSEAIARVRAVLHRPRTTRSGATRSTTRRRGVREWAIQNAELWVRDYHVDGLRLDAVHAIFDDSPHARPAPSSPSACARSTRRARHLRDGDRRPAADRGVGPRRAVGRRAAPRAARAADRRARGLLRAVRLGRGPRARSSSGRPAERLVVCAQNHDQVGNRALGDRLPPDALPRRRGASSLFAPQTPLLFMGEEYGERRPFQFFTDHIDPAIADATREGRRQEFAAFAAFSRRGRARPAGRRRRSCARSSTRRRRPRAARVLPRAARAAARAAARGRDARSTRSAASCACAAAHVELVADFAREDGGACAC